MPWESKLPSPLLADDFMDAPPQPKPPAEPNQTTQISTSDTAIEANDDEASLLTTTNNSRNMEPTERAETNAQLGSGYTNGPDTQLVASTTLASNLIESARQQQDREFFKKFLQSADMMTEQRPIGAGASQLGLQSLPVDSRPIMEQANLPPWAPAYTLPLMYSAFGQDGSGREGSLIASPSSSSSTTALLSGSSLFYDELGPSSRLFERNERASDVGSGLLDSYEINQSLAGSKNDCPFGSNLADLKTSQHGYSTALNSSGIFEAQRRLASGSHDLLDNQNPFVANRQARHRIDFLSTVSMQQQPQQQHHAYQMMMMTAGHSPLYGNSTPSMSSQRNLGRSAPQRSQTGTTSERFMMGVGKRRNKLPSSLTTKSAGHQMDQQQQLSFNQPDQEVGERFSRKVFVGGLPPDIDEEEIKSSFRRFGSLLVDWPHKAESKSYFPPKGYAFLLFHEEASVQALIDSCFQEMGKLYLCVSSPTIKDKPVQIRPWRLSDTDYVLDSTLALDPRKTVFVGGVPRPLKASELATIMNNLYGGVCYAGIDTDPELKYPKGAGRVAFSNHQSYIAAISARFVHIHHSELEKRVEVKPYVLDDQFCDECQGARCNNKFAPFFCANINCLRYYCDQCWSTMHAQPGREFHKPLVKEGGDRPRAAHSFRW